MRTKHITQRGGDNNLNKLLTSPWIDKWKQRGWLEIVLCNLAKTIENNSLYYFETRALHVKNGPKILGLSEILAVKYRPQPIWRRVQILTGTTHKVSSISRLQSVGGSAQQSEKILGAKGHKFCPLCSQSEFPLHFSGREDLWCRARFLLY